MKKKYFYFSLLLLTISSFSQRISVNTTQTPTQLINSLFNSGVCANISGVTITPGLQGTGNNSPFGSYTNNGTGNVFSQGMIISTGFARRTGDTFITITLSNNLNDFFNLQNLNVKKLIIFNSYGIKAYSKRDIETMV